jgi:hypothetical protein
LKIKNPHDIFHRALKKRPDDFVWSVLISAHTQEELDTAESAFIHELQTLHPSGYNFSAGGQGCRNRTCSPETRTKLAVAKRGKKFSEEHRKNIGLASKGRKVSLETRLKMSQTRKGQMFFSEEHRRKLSEAARQREARKKAARES